MPEDKVTRNESNKTVSLNQHTFHETQYLLSTSAN